MGKMTDALRKAKMMKDQREGRVSAPTEAPAPAPAQERIAPRVEPPKPKPVVVVKPPEPEPVVMPEAPAYAIVDEEPGEVAQPETDAMESLTIVDEPEEEAAPKPAPVIQKPVIAREPVIVPKRAQPAPLVFEAVDEKPAAPAPKAPEKKTVPPPPIAAKAPEPEVVVKPPSAVKKPEPAIAFEPPAPKPEPKPIAWAPEAPAPRAEEKPAPAPAPVPVLAKAPEPEPVLPEVEPTPKPSRLPYLSVHYGRDEKLCDEFRRLKARLNEEGAARLILVVSARAGEGKTTVALNLATSYANTFGEKVVVVDGNAARPKITEVLEVPEGSPGLSRAVRGQATAEEAAVETEIHGLWAVAPGDPGSRRDEGLLDSDGMRSVLTELRKRFTRVIVEIPAAEDLPEGLALAAQADVVLVPVLKTRSRRRLVKRLIETLKDRGASRVRCVFIEA